MCLKSGSSSILLLLVSSLLTTMLSAIFTATAMELAATGQAPNGLRRPQAQLQQHRQSSGVIRNGRSSGLLEHYAVEVGGATDTAITQTRWPVSASSSPLRQHDGDHNRHNNAIDINYTKNSPNGGLQSAEEARGEGLYPPPYFDFGLPRNITARSGQTAAINCRVENLGDKSVSWIRKRDLHILTAGILTYTSDERFKVQRTADSKNWSLLVRYAQPRDSGIYECQVNTEPKISMAFRLNVIVTPPDAKAFISGPADLYVKVGSAITLTCHVRQPSSAHDIGPIHWYRGPYILTPFAVHPNEAAIDMRRISMESKLGDQLQSRLRISNAQTGDSGNYTCMPTTADASSVLVNVINDESPAAMQKSAAVSAHRGQGASRRWTAAGSVGALLATMALRPNVPRMLRALLVACHIFGNISSTASS